MISRADYIDALISLVVLIFGIMGIGAWAFFALVWFLWGQDKQGTVAQ